MSGKTMVDAAGGRVKTVVAANPGPLTLDGTRTYILGPAPCVVIDPGPDLADHLDAVEVALTLQVAALCVTHYHADHAAGAADLILRLAAPLAATPVSAEKAALDPPDLPLSPYSTLSFGGGHLEVVPAPGHCADHAPGHCADHVCFYWPQARALFTGDVVLGEGTSMIAPPEGDMAAYMATLERLVGLDLSIIYPGHGPEITEPAERLDEYIAHRLEREQQVLDALAAGADTPAEIRALVYGADTPAEIRALVYGDLDPRLFGAAEGSVLAHLTKLTDEGYVRVEEDRYLPMT
jgi:glyoxylase-like metal-dependent hydrolase (beta-lactamase superfamily II)